MIPGRPSISIPAAEVFSCSFDGGSAIPSLIPSAKCWPKLYLTFYTKPWMISRIVFQSSRLAKLLLILTLCFTLLLCGLNELTPHSLFSKYNVFSVNELTVKNNKQMDDKSLSKTSWGKKLLKFTGTKIQALFHSRVDRSVKGHQCLVAGPPGTK